MLRTLILSLCLSSLVASAQAEAPWMPLPMPATPGPLPPQNGVVLPTDPLKFGGQFHAEVQGGTNGFGTSVSMGLGFNRVAILFTPTVLISSFASSLSLGVGVRIYFKSRQQGALVGFIRPEAMVGSAGSQFFGSGVFFGGIGVGGGAEYLLTRNLGFTAELGLRYLSAGQAFSTVGMLGLMLHT